MVYEDIILQSFDFYDIRFPTYLEQHGSDAIHTSPCYSAAYIKLNTNKDNTKGYGFAFTLGRGNDIVISCIKALEFVVLGKTLSEIINDFGRFCYKLSNECQLRWLGPQKGAIHLATAAIINSIWDLWARLEDKPLWKLITDMTPHQIVDLLDFTYVEDFLTKEMALEILERNQVSKEERESFLLHGPGYPAYITSAGWLGYSDDTIKQNLKDCKSKGFNKFKIKVGQDIDVDEKRIKFIRSLVDDNDLIMIDANQIWSVNESIINIKRLAKYNLYWVEEPTCCDDVLGHLVICRSVDRHDTKIATGEHCCNAVMFKQFLSSGAMQVCQIDSCRLAGPNEVLMVVLMAAHANVPICPHAGGVGLCELVQHYSFIDYLIGSGKMEDRMLEFADHLHEYFENPVVVKNGHYQVPKTAGFGAKFVDEAIHQYSYPDGRVWRDILGNV